jgi:GAF domain-containing protein
MCFLALQHAIFCVQCELISASNTPRCSACGSQAVLSLSRILGGSLQGKPQARLIEDEELNRLVRELLRTVPSDSDAEEVGRTASSVQPRQRRRCFSQRRLPQANLAIPKFELQPAISVIAERAQVLTGATGAAVGLRKGQEVICRARVGRTAPDIGVRLQTNCGISAQCLRTGQIVLCNNAEADPHADRLICERLGVRSILAAPLRQWQQTVGIFEVLSAVPNAFNHQDVATIELLASMMTAAIARVAQRSAAPTLH